MTDAIPGADSELTEDDVVREAVVAAKDNQPQSELLGECCYNARRAADELQERGFDADIVRGAVTNNGDHPETAREAEERGIVHWWARYEAADGRVIVVDLATEIDRIKGETIVSEQPEEYTPLEVNPPNTDVFATRSEK